MWEMTDYAKEPSQGKKDIEIFKVRGNIVVIYSDHLHSTAQGCTYAVTPRSRFSNSI